MLLCYTAHVMRLFLCAVALCALCSCAVFHNKACYETYSAEDYNNIPAYREIVDHALRKEADSHSMLAYVLREGFYVVCVFGDAMGTIYYHAQSYRMTDEQHYEPLSKIFYSNHRDFEKPEIRGNKLWVRSKATRKEIIFDLLRGGSYAEE